MIRPYRFRLRLARLSKEPRPPTRLGKKKRRNGKERNKIEKRLRIVTLPPLPQAVTSSKL